MKTMQNLNVQKNGKISLAAKVYRYSGKARRKFDHSLTAITDEYIKKELEFQNPVIKEVLLLSTKKFRHLYRKYLRNLEYSVKVISGTSNLSGEKLNFVYIGDNWSIEYLEHILFHNHRTLSVGSERVFSASIKKVAGQYQHWADLIVFERNLIEGWTPPCGEWLKVPRWVNMIYQNDEAVVQDQETWVQTFTKHHNANYAKVKKAGFFPCISRSQEDFEFFYHSMYLPLVKKRFGDYAETASEEYVLSKSKDGKLLFSCLPNGKKVGAILMLPYKKTIYGWVNGILNGDPELYKMGVLSSLYIFSMQYAVDHGIRTLDMGGVRPFENNGLYMHKKRWGFEPTIDPWLTTDWLFWIPSGSTQMLNWLKKNRFLPQFAEYKGAQIERIYAAEGNK